MVRSNTPVLLSSRNGLCGSATSVESTFAAVRQRGTSTKDCVSGATFLGLTFELMQRAQKSWRRIRGVEGLADLHSVQGRDFRRPAIRRGAEDCSPISTCHLRLTIPALGHYEPLHIAVPAWRCAPACEILASCAPLSGARLPAAVLPKLPCQQRVVGGSDGCLIFLHACPVGAALVLRALEFRRFLSLPNAAALS